MKKYNACLFLLAFCFLVSGCTTSNVDAKEIYTKALEHMNTNVYYFKGEHKTYLYDTLTTDTRIERVLSDEAKENLSISTITLPPDDTIKTSIFDGTTIHQYEISETQNIFKYENPTIGQDDILKKPIFQSIINTSVPLKITDSKVENKDNKQFLYFTVSSTDSEGKVNWIVKYIITIHGNYIIQEESLSYPNGEDTVSQRDVITYSDINTTKTIDIQSALKEMESKRP